MMIAIIGAGMAGAACASLLKGRGREVVIFDKGRSVGGRMAQRRQDGFVFDHGAQFVTARDPIFARKTEEWLREGALAIWPSRIHAGQPVLVGTPSMSAPVKLLLAGLDVRTGTRVVRLWFEAGEWRLATEAGRDFGPFEAVVLAIPAVQAVELLESADGADVAEFAASAGATVSAPCWALMLGFEAPMSDAILSTLRAARSAEDALAWFGDAEDKPARMDRHTLVVHASAAWSRAHLEEPADAIAPRMEAMVRAFAGPDLPATRYLAAHRWRHALVEKPLGRPFLFDPAIRLGLCGDWCLAARIEAAFVSGHALARAIIGDDT